MINDRKGLQILFNEYNQLASKGKWSKQDEKRAAFLQSGIAAIKAGATLQEVELDNLNETEKRTGLPTTQLTKPTDADKEFRSWQGILNSEKRTMVEGAPMLNHIGTFTSLGYFVPNADFFPGIFAALKAHDVLFNEDDCTVIRSTNGRPLPVPVAGDTENVASVVGEAYAQTSTDLSSTKAVILGAYSYATPRMVVSQEAFQDIDVFIPTIAMFSKFVADRLARGIGADMLNGNGSGKTLGLLSSLAALSAPNVVATGASVNTGGAETGSNSIGSDDFATALSTLDEAYVNNAKTAWIMNRATLAKVSSIINKFGDTLNLVQYIDGQPFIFGIPVKVSPGMPSIGASNVPVVLGDFSYWCTRLIQDENAGVVVYKEAPGLVENGLVGIGVRARADGVLAFTDTSSPFPFVTITNHS
jgi:HK97 family phage major capsid protein